MNARPRLVVLDGHTLNPGDLSWAALEALGDCAIHAHTLPAEVVAPAGGLWVLSDGSGGNSGLG